MRLLPTLVLKSCPWVGACLCSLHVSKWLWWESWIQREQMTILLLWYTGSHCMMQRRAWVRGSMAGAQFEPGFIPGLTVFANISWVRPYPKGMGQTLWAGWALPQHNGNSLLGWISISKFWKPQLVKME